MSKYIHNLSGIEKTYRGYSIDNNSYFEIPPNQIINFANDDLLLADITAGDVFMSKDGVSDLSGISRQLGFLRDDLVLDVDDQGRQVNRVAAAKAGWTYLAHSFEFETSKLGSFYCKDQAGNDDTSFTFKLYDANGTEITTQGTADTDCVETRLLFKPSFDYELVAGNIHHIERPASDVRVWVIGGIIELGGVYIREMVRGLNMRFLGTENNIETDGRASKYMAKDIEGSPYQGNQLQFKVKHAAGEKHRIMLVLEYFRS